MVRKVLCRMGKVSVDRGRRSEVQEIGRGSKTKRLDVFFSPLGIHLESTT